MRLDEWAELVDECGEFLAEIDEEFAKHEFTLGELEEEQSRERLRRWLETLQARDVLGLPDAGRAAEALQRCEARLAEYAERVMHEQNGDRAGEGLIAL